MKKDILKTIFLWLPIAALLSILCLLVYTGVQQDLRMSANDPQIQTAEDITAYLGNGAPPDAVISPNQAQIDISTSLDTYAAIFNASGTVLVSSANLHGSPLALPSGVFASVRTQGEKRFTWQPESGVRSAVVVTAWNSNGNSGFVLAGRSLREVEKRENNLVMIVGLAWIMGLVFLLILIFILVRIHPKIMAQNL